VTRLLLSLAVVTRAATCTSCSTTAARLWQARRLEGRVRLIVASLHYGELANVLRTYVRRAEIDAGLAAEIHSLHLEAPLGPSG
jgi:hypothetical protein